ELVSLYKEAALKVAREEIRANILEVLFLLKQCPVNNPKMQGAAVRNSLGKAH
ncbi:hypothetical protein LINPERHAP1_LOCUS28515, partial [Linum perenne]